MITLKICSSDLNQIEEIALFLLKQRLAIDININENITRVNLEKEELKKSYVHELNGKTRALLFHDIDQQIKKQFKPVPEIYSSPIVHMDWEQSKQLAKNIVNV